MNGNAELLNFVYQNSQMGVETISRLVEIAQDEAFLQQLCSQLREYTEINETAKRMLNENGYDEKAISAFEKLSAYLMINLKTINDKTPSHIAEMMLQGSNMGIIDAIKNMRKYKNAEKNILSLMGRLLEFEENNVKALKEYL